MSDIKIVFFDIDGTLIDMKKKHMTEKTLDMLRRLKKNGVIICIATGRTPVTIPHFEGIEFDAFLTFNGSYCYNQSETIFSSALEKQDVHTIIRNATEINRPVSIATKDRLSANGRDDDLVKYYSFAKLEVEVTDDFEQVANEEVYQIMLGCHVEDYPQLMKDVHNAKITAWWDRAVDIIPATGGKGIGVKKMLEYYHLDKSQAMAFGDGNNDIEMFQEVGTSVAMGNSSKELKEIANDVCGDVSEDGIYHYCLENRLI